VEELVSGFMGGRKGLLEFARNTADLERKGLEEDESTRPKKRRKVQAPRIEQSEAERRSTRSQSRRDAVKASQESAGEQIVADSDDAGSEYEEEEDTPNRHSATKLQRAQVEPIDGLVACPGCGKRMKEEVVFTHLDSCPSSGGSEVPDSVHEPPPHPPPPQQKPRPSITYTPPGSLSSAKVRERLPTLAYSMLNETALRKKLHALGISSQGPKLLLQKRHTEWVNLWNANCDSRDPKTKRKLIDELEVWEKTQGRQILQGMNAATGGGQGTGVMAKDFDSESWMKGNKNDFEELVRRAREKKATAPSTEDKPKGPERGSSPKKTAQEIFRNAAGASTHTNGAPSDMPSSDTETEAGVGAGVSTNKSPFFDTSVDTPTKTEGSGDIPRPSPSKPPIDLETATESRIAC
jgi:E3 ubiquitin-protein ligase RAD18